MDIGKCVHLFGLQTDDQLMVIKENHLAEANFVLPYILKQIYENANNSAILILTHNTLAHYDCIGKRLGYCLRDKIKDGILKVMDVQDMLVRSLYRDDEDLSEYIYATLLQHISQAKLKKPQNIDLRSGRVYIIIDDLSHLLDYTMDFNGTINRLNEILGSRYNDQRVVYIIGLHVGNASDHTLSKHMEYSADSIVDISTLTTGRSTDLSGVMRVIRSRKLLTYHFKLRTYGADIYKPGEVFVAR